METAPLSLSLPPYFNGLNPEQLRAAQHTEGPLLILAGAGTGKTRVLTTRLAYILNTRKAYPSQVLAVTFTNKAAQEMKERVATLLGAAVEGWWLGTFHALAARMLRKHAELAGLNSSFTILDTDDQLRLIKQILEAENIDTKKTTPKLVASIIDRWKDRALTPEQINADQAGDAANGRIVQIYRLYQARLKTLNCCDFGDLLLHVIHILKNNPEVLAEYHKRFRYILVDEYQDTNVAQYIWLRLLAQGSRNICCVGDDDQSIYGWRGAEVTNILRFERDFEGAETVRLEQNYRSTSNILAAASGVIAQNKGRLGKTLWSEGEAGEKVFVRGLWDGQKEATYIAEEIEAQQRRNKTNLRQMAILVRAGFQMREFEEKLMGSGIAYRVFGGPRFYERAEIRDALAYLRLVVQPADDLAFERIINLPKRGIGEQTLVQLRSHARLKNTSLFEATRDLCDTDDLKPKMRATLAALLQDFVRWAGLLDNTPHPELAGMVLDQSGYMAMWQADKSPEAQGRIENLKELVSGMAEFESLPQFLEYVALVMENNEKGSTSNDYVSLMTLHGAKGLEFDVVFLPGWEEGLFPSQRSMDESGVKGLEEERRLAYVGLTRARKVAYVTYAANRLVYGKYVSALPSRFVDELPEEVIDSEGEQGLYAPQADYAPRYSSAAAPAFGGRNGGGYTSAPKKQSDFGRGQRVVHGSFGSGTVVSVEGNKLDILFDDGEMRRLMDSFVEPSSN